MLKAWIKAAILAKAKILIRQVDSTLAFSTLRYFTLVFRQFQDDFEASKKIKKGLMESEEDLKQQHEVSSC